MKQPDPNAMGVARAIRQTEQPELTILFGSRARGDHDEKSDVDIMLVQDQEPGTHHKRLAARRAQDTAREIYGRLVSVDLVWRTLPEFQAKRKYSNSIETRAVEEGQLMPRNPEEYSAYDYDDEETEQQLDWSIYEQRLRHAEVHLAGFINNCDAGLDDILIGQQAQNTLEYGMKTLLEAHDARYRNVHDTGELLGNVPVITTQPCESSTSPYHPTYIPGTRANGNTGREPNPDCPISRTSKQELYPTPV